MNVASVVITGTDIGFDQADAVPHIAMVVAAVKAFGISWSDFDGVLTTGRVFEGR